MVSPPGGYRIAWLLAGMVAGLALTAPGTSPSLAQSDLGPSIDKIQIAGVVRELGPRLAALDRLLAEKRWQDAVDEYIDLLRQHGDDLVPIDPTAEPLATGQRFVAARWLIHQRLAALGPEVWKAFRNRTQIGAQQSYERAAEERDSRQLRRIVDEAFCSPAAARALEMLGDLAFERGNFCEAEHWWSLLAAPASAPVETGRHRPLLFPDPAEEFLARVRAKQIVGMLFQEQAWRARKELVAYRQAHGAAVGDLAGRRGNYGDTIEGLLKSKQGELPAAEQEWPTFGGGPGRGRVLAQALAPGLWADGPAWRVRLETGEKIPDTIAAKMPAGDELARHPPCHPIIVGDTAFVADARFVRGYALRSGRLIFQYDLAEGRNLPVVEDLQFKADGRYTLTASQQHLFARLGGQCFGPVKEGEKRPSASWLVCLRLPTSAEVKSPLERWTVQAPAKDQEPIAFEGAPLVLGKSVYIVQSRLRGVLVLASLCCFNAETGALRWEQDLVEAPEFSSSATLRCQHHLLTQAGPYLVYCAHAGAVVAVEAATGKRAWAVRYTGRGLRLPARQPRPALAAGQSLVVAPADLDRLLCLDTATGKSLWQREAIDVVQLLGISDGLLVFTTPEGLRAVEAATGDDRGGWVQPVVGSLRTSGRGLLAGGKVYWSTQDARLPWRAFTVWDGAAGDPSLLRALPPGNMAVGRGCLVVATAEELWGFTPPPPLVGPAQT
jgi:outer membrane protein assembly factor BamB